MRVSKVKQKWKNGGLALGRFIKSIDPVHTEVVSQMGFPGQLQREEVLSVTKQVADATLAAGKVFGSLVFDMDHSGKMQDMVGARLLIHGADILYCKKAYEQLLKEYLRKV